MTRTSTLRTAALVVSLAIAGAVLWVAAVFSVAQFAEDLCFYDLNDRTGYGAYTTDAKLWPPSYKCRLLGNDVEPIVVQHRVIALARFGATVVAPLAYLLAATLGTVFIRQRGRPRSPVAPNSS